MTSEELALYIKNGEGLSVEFKERYSSKIAKDIVAFSNSKGGILLLGVSDDGTVSGEELNNSKKASISTLARNCSPAIEVQIEYIDRVIVLTIKEGMDKPYSCSEGYFRRLDSVTQKLSAEEIRKLYRDHTKISFEDKICNECEVQDLSSEKINKFLSESRTNLKVNDDNLEEVVKSLNLVKENRILNTAVLFFAKRVDDYFLHSQISLLRYTGENKLHVFDRNDIRDDLLTQFIGAIFFLQKHLNRGSEIKGLNREDEYEIPLEVLREALANALVHRDYSIAGTSIWVEIFSDRVEITNPGGLPPGLEKRNFGKISVRRNERIADLFYRMKKVEKIGSGIQRIKNLMRNKKLEPPYFEINSSFKVTFYRPIYSVKLSHNERRIIRYMKENESITKRELSAVLNVSPATVDNYIVKLKDKNILERKGPNKGGYWNVLL